MSRIQNFFFFFFNQQKLDCAVFLQTRLGLAMMTEVIHSREQLQRGKKSSTLQRRTNLE